MSVNDVDYNQFVQEFDLVENALDMRTLYRWNGRDVRERENLAEHTHLVTACAIKLYDKISELGPALFTSFDFEKIVRLAMYHDALELLRGDILSITKDKVEGLREKVDAEEATFLEKMVGPTVSAVTDLVRLADLMACYKFIEYELRYPSNDFLLTVYDDVKSKYDNYYKEFCEKYRLPMEEIGEEPAYRFSKGYQEDAGIDVLLTEDVVFMPHSTRCVDLNVQVTPHTGHMAFLCARTSAAAKGLSVAMCPIDPNFTGNVTAIVHNISNKIVRYNKGDSFCQVIYTKFHDPGNYTVRKKGKRSDGKLGSTGGSNAGNI